MIWCYKESIQCNYYPDGPEYNVYKKIIEYDFISNDFCVAFYKFP